MKRVRGFTLMEVLVALAVLAIALIAIVGASGQSVHQAAGLRERTLAHWIADNKVTELRLSNQWPDTGESDGDYDMATQHWRWTMNVVNTPDPDLRRVDVKVALADKRDDTIATATGFVGRPVPHLQLEPQLQGGGDGNTPPPPPGSLNNNGNNNPPPNKNPASGNRGGNRN